MGTRVWWYNPTVGNDDDGDCDMVADKWDSYTLTDMMACFFPFDTAPPEIDEPYYYKKEKWQELHAKTPLEVGPEGYTCPSYYTNSAGERVTDGHTVTFTQERFMKARPLLKLIAEDPREVYEA